MPKYLTAVGFLIYCFFHPAISGAQVTHTADSTFLSSLNANAASYYNKSVGDNWGLNNGSEYVGSYSGTVGHPFFESDKLQPGNIFYDGIFYSNIPLSYDILRDELITTGPNQNFNIKLVPEKIRYFSILNHVFVKIDADSSVKNQLAPGFYDLLEAGKLSVLVKRIKQVQTGIRAEDKSRFVEYDNYFVKKDKSYYPVDSEKSLLALFGDQKADVRKFLKKENLKYRRDPATTITKAVHYYSQLKN